MLVVTIWLVIGTHGSGSIEASLWLKPIRLSSFILSSIENSLCWHLMHLILRIVLRLLIGGTVNNDWHTIHLLEMRLCLENVGDNLGLKLVLVGIGILILHSKVPLVSIEVKSSIILVLIVHALLVGDVVSM